MPPKIDFGRIHKSPNYQKLPNEEKYQVRKDYIEEFIIGSEGFDQADAPQAYEYFQDKFPITGESVNVLSEGFKSAKRLIPNIDPSKEVEDFKYLGSFVSSCFKDFTIRKGMAWDACSKLRKIWTSGIAADLKVRFFRACVEPVLLYGSEAWTFNKRLSDRLDGCYTRMLRTVRNLDWRDHPTISDIYGSVPRISSIVSQRRARFAGHCHRASDQPVSTIMTWRVQQSGRGRRPITFMDSVAAATGYAVEDLPVAMNDRAVWKCAVDDISTKSRRK